MNLILTALAMVVTAPLVLLTVAVTVAMLLFSVAETFIVAPLILLAVGVASLIAAAIDAARKSI